jgi:ethanolamine utilization cobalamin adenosyltransferase
MQLEQIDTDTARLLVKVSKRVAAQVKLDSAVAAALDRILMNAPAETLRPLAKQLRKRIREISNG